MTTLAATRHHLDQQSRNRAQRFAEAQGIAPETLDLPAYGLALQAALEAPRGRLPDPAAYLRPAFVRVPDPYAYPPAPTRPAPRPRRASGGRQRTHRRVGRRGVALAFAFGLVPMVAALVVAYRQAGVDGLRLAGLLLPLGLVLLWPTLRFLLWLERQETLR